MKSIVLHGLCVVIECNGMGIHVDVGLCGCLNGASIGLGPLVDGDMRLPPADVAASLGEQNAHPAARTTQNPEPRTTTQSPDRQVKLAIAPIPAFLRGTLVLSLRPVA